MGDSEGYSKYGVIKRLSVGDNKKTRQAWNKMTGKSYRSGTSFISNLFNGIFDFMNLVFGFSTSDDGPTISDEIQEPIARDEGPEIMRAFIAEDIKNKNPEQSSNIINTIDKPQIIVNGAYISNKGKESQEQAHDITSTAQATGDNTVTVTNDIQQNPEDAAITRQNQLRISMQRIGERYVNHTYSYIKNVKKYEKFEDITNNEYKYYNIDGVNGLVLITSDAEGEEINASDRYGVCDREEDVPEGKTFKKYNKKYYYQDDDGSYIYGRLRLTENAAENYKNNNTTVDKTLHTTHYCYDLLLTSN